MAALVRSTMCAGQWLRRMLCSVSGRSRFWLMGKRRPPYWVTDGIDRCGVGFLKRHMVKHAGRFDGALVQVTKVFSADPRVSDTAEQKMHHQNHGCALGTVVLAMNEIKKNCESLVEYGRKRKVQEDAGYPLNKKYGLPIPKTNDSNLIN